ncbi:MAG TPA: hypothetical protein VLA04_04200 [Verrucomicrobiae bacterium]|nr:hypothetical protein [Verrucomicrobiae bacterium]
MENHSHHLTDRITHWVGSTASLVIHTFVFIFSFLVHWIFNIPLDSILLFLTTAVSLEAIYLALFIQRSVVQQSARLEDVEESIDEVEEALDDVGDDIEESGAKYKRTTQRSERTLRDLHSAIKDLHEAVESLKSEAARSKQ